VKNEIPDCSPSGVVQRKWFWNSPSGLVQVWQGLASKAGLGWAHWALCSASHPLRARLVSSEIHRPPVTIPAITALYTHSAAGRPPPLEHEASNPKSVLRAG
jgi:hypothetical protein